MSSRIVPTNTSHTFNQTLRICDLLSRGCDGVCCVNIRCVVEPSLSYIHTTQTLYAIPPRVLRNTAEVISGKPIAV
jgi:hypothetical protein